MPDGYSVPVINGGTGAVNATDARTNLGLGSAATKDYGTATFNADKLQGISISTTQPQDKQGLVYNSTTQKWEPGSAGHAIQDEGTPVTPRSNLNLLGFTVTDDAANDATKVTVPTTSYIHSFTNSDLVDGTLTVTHNLNERYAHVTIVNGAGDMVIPGAVSFMTVNMLTVQLIGFMPLAETWHVVVSVGGGTSVGSLAYVDNIDPYTAGHGVLVDGVLIKDGTIPASCLASETPSGKFLKDDGTWAAVSGGTGAGGHTIQNAGVDKDARSNLNFIGFTVADDAANDATKITLPTVEDVSFTSTDLSDSVLVVPGLKTVASVVDNDGFNSVTSIRYNIVDNQTEVDLTGFTVTGTWLVKFAQGLGYAAGVAGMANPMGMAGDIIYGGADGEALALHKGVNGQILKLVAGVPAWVDLPTLGTAAAVDYSTATFNADKLQSRTVSSTAPSAGQSLVWDGSSWAPSQPQAVVMTLTKTGHGLVALDATNRTPVTLTLGKAKADSAADVETAGLLVEVVDLNTVKVAHSGKVAWTSHGFTGPAVFLSDATAGACTDTAPTTEGNYIKTMFKVLDANTVLVVDYPATLI
jgi:hypothetical protein